MGLLTSVLFLGILVLTVLAPWFDRRIGLRNALRLTPVLFGLGGVLCVVASSFPLLLVGRALVGVAGGITLVMAPVAARAVGGALLVGLYGSAITIAVALALFIGGVLSNAGVDWRVNFVVSAVLSASAFPLLLGRFPDIARDAGHAGGEMLRLFLTIRYWRIALVFLLCVTVPIVVSAWLVHYLTEDDAMSAGFAGVLGFGLFAVAAVVRPLGGKIDTAHHKYLLAASPFLAAVGLAGLALDNAPAIAIPAIVLLGIGFSLPYAVSYIRSEDLLPGRPTVGLSAEMITTNSAPIFLTPALGAALEHGHATAGWLALTGFAAVAGLVNLPRPPVREHEPAAQVSI